MNHLLAIVSSNEKAVPLAAEAASPFFQDAPRDAGTCSGLACFGPDGEPLVSRQPTVGHPSADSLRRSLAGGFLLQQLSETPEGGFKAEEIGPYKFRRWIGTVATPVSSGGDEDHVLAVPAFISQNIKGSRPAEETFHVFLSFMHSYRNLTAASPDLPTTRRAVDAALTTLCRYGDPRQSVAMAVCDGRTLTIKSHKRPLCFAVLGDTADAQTELGSGTRLPVRGLPTRAVVVTDCAMDDAAGWTRLPDGSFLQVDRIGRYEIIQGAVPK